uniref:CUB_2 domain-containing protein n=1 Tax=Caenorhabditis japonica TaxID=281687 RepID=A0A8R1DFJ1_CAEJA
MLLYLLLLSTFVISAAADGYVCGGDRLINPTEENEYTWPAGWKDNEPPAEYSGKQSCEWQINVLEGTYAMVTFYKETDSESGIKTTYPNGKEQYIEDNDPNPYFFTYPQFKVNMWVSDDKPGRFSFKVVWIPYPGACQMNIDLEQSQPMALTPIECHVTFKAPHNVILVGFSTEDNGALDNDLLRQSAVFEGNSINGEYLGNLYDAKYNEIVSRTNQLTVYTFNLDKTINYTLAIGMDINGKRTSDEQPDFSEDTDDSEEEDSVVLEDEDVSRIFPADEDSEEEYDEDVNEVSRRDVAIVGEEIGSEEY